MKKTLAIVLALAMVLCMIPAAFADLNETVTDKSYGLTIYAIESTGTNWNNTYAAKKTNANSITAEYDYETAKEVTTGKFTEDKIMAMVKVDGFFDKNDETLSDVEVTIDGKKLEVNGNAVYSGDVGWRSADKSVNFPVELTKAGYSDTYLIEVTGTYKNSSNDTVNYKETAKISVKLVNTAEYKTAKTATISKIESKDPKKLDAYIVGSKIYLDYVNQKDDAQSVEITFKDENGKLFDVVTWAEQTACDVAGSGAVIYKTREEKLEDSKTTYAINAAKAGTEKKYFTGVIFKLETSAAKYETKEYEVVVRENIKEADPKGIYFAETTKTIKIGESYTPVLMGVATNKKVDAALDYGTNTSREVIDIEDGDTVIGTKEGVAYITASYTPAGGWTNYNANSMKIVVTAGQTEETTGGAKYIVTASSLNVRSGAGTNYAKVGSLANGAIVTVDTIANGWAKLSNGNYVSAQYLAKVVENGEAQTMYVTCRTLNVRKGPGTSYAKAGTLSRGTAVQVVGMTGSWAKLSNGYYVSANYLSK